MAIDMRTSNFFGPVVTVADPWMPEFFISEFGAPNRALSKHEIVQVALQDRRAFKLPQS